MTSVVKTYQRSNLTYACAYEDNGEDHGGLRGVVACDLHGVKPDGGENNRLLGACCAKTTKNGTILGMRSGVGGEFARLEWRVEMEDKKKKKKQFNSMGWETRRRGLQGFHAR